MEHNENNYLSHHGIRGQKWGIRRYQNEDGTLTNAGKSRYVKAYEDVVTDYEYKYDFINGRLRLLPNTHTVKHKAVYQLKYRTIYDDLTFKDEWVDVSKAEYDEYEKIKNSGG